MTLITFQDGKPVMRGGMVGTEQSCCCDCPPCPDFSALCVSVSITDYNGNTLTADQDDIFWDDEGTYGSAFVGGFEYQLEIVCVQNVLAIAVFWNGFIQNCNCTAGFGEALFNCQYLVTASFPIEFDDAGGPCLPACPGSPGSATITISEPPC